MPAVLFYLHYFTWVSCPSIDFLCEAGLAYLGCSKVLFRLQYRYMDPTGLDRPLFQIAAVCIRFLSRG